MTPLTFEFFAMFLYLFLIVFELFLYCHQANKIIIEVSIFSIHKKYNKHLKIMSFSLFPQSGQIYTSIFNSNWYDLDLGYVNTRQCLQNYKTKPKIWLRNNILIIMACIKKPISITAGKLFVLRYETFFSVNINIITTIELV